MNLSNLIKTTTKSKKRVGRGYGSGRGGHASGRGTKGQKARGSIGLIFEGTKLKKSWIKRLPLVRGKGKFKSSKRKSVIINLDQLAIFKDKETVSVDALIQKGLLPKNFDKKLSIKILAEGEIDRVLQINLPCSKSAAEKVVKAGGKVEF